MSKHEAKWLVDGGNSYKHLPQVPDNQITDGQIPNGQATDWDKVVIENSDNDIMYIVDEADTKGKKYDSDKLRYDLIDPKFEENLAKVLTFGAKKYGDNNWKKVTPLEDRYYAALRRHLSAWRQGELNDEESGQRHLAHAACCLYFLFMNDEEVGQ